jgi:hypothetical protein
VEAGCDTCSEYVGIGSSQTMRLPGNAEEMAIQRNRSLVM